MAGKAENADYAGKLKQYLGLRYEPVAIKLVKKGDAFPGNFSEPEKQMSHCQAVFGAKNGMCISVFTLVDALSRRPFRYRLNGYSNRLKPSAERERKSRYRML